MLDLVRIPKKEHSDTIIHICTYIRDTSTQGIILDPDPTKSLETCVDVDLVVTGIIILLHTMSVHQNPVLAMLSY